MRSYWICLAVFLIFVISAPTVQGQSAPSWTPGTYYPTGAQVTYGGITYSCLQAHTAIVSWEPSNVPALWQPVNPKGTPTCTTTPGAPQGLTASGTTSSGTTLNWSIAAVPSGCAITGYNVYRNGTSIATVS